MGKKVTYFLTNEDPTGIELALENKQDDKTICLLQNAVYFANKSDKQTLSAINQGIKVVACKEDVDIRGLEKYLLNNVEIKNYADIVDIIFDSDSIMNI